LFGEFSVPLAELEYYKASYEHKWFFPISRIFTVMLNGGVGVGDGYSGESLPFFKNFFAGGFNSVRGYNINSLGPRDPRLDSNGNVIPGRGTVVGGSKRVVGSVELLFPAPFMKDSRSVRLAAFVDGGNVFSDWSELDLNYLRYSTGLAVTWISPMGPLRFSVAQPLNDQSGDDIQRFQFQLGQTF
jgi:outer membrane protein insertion porin family